MRFILLISAVILLFSCSKYTYLDKNETVSPVTQNKKGFFTFENDTLKIVYSFWENGGVIAFSIYNKLSIPLYVNWKKSSLVLNSRKLDYWKDERITNTIAKGRSATAAVSAYNPVGTLVTLTGGDNVQLIAAATEIPEMITFIAPESYIFKQRFNLVSETKSIHPKWTDGTIPHPRKGSIKCKYVEFDYQHSPINFRNFFTISTSENFSTESYISHQFYVTKAIKIKTKKAVKDEYVKNRGWGKTYFYYNPSYFYLQVTE